MSHPLNQAEASFAAPLGRVWVGVKAEYRDGALVVDPSFDRFIRVVRTSALFAEVPARLRVLRDVKGRIVPVKPFTGRRFWISTETVDPWHVVIEAEEVPLRPLPTTEPRADA